jgi:xanthine dehydrogenase YagT iron-sulfur-binding subunit
VSVKQISFREGHMSTSHASDASASGETAAAGADAPHIEGPVPITLRINGKDHRLRIDPRTTLQDCIRETAGLTGTNKGCDHGRCGARTVLVNGRQQLSQAKAARRLSVDQPKVSALLNY